MTETRRRIDRIRDPEFEADLSDMPMEELRAKRTMCEDLDNELSYYRRLLHGRIDLLTFEQRRRSGEEQRSLIDALPEILAGSETRHVSSGRQVPVVMPDVPAPGRREVDVALGDDFLAHLPEIDDGELDEIRNGLVEAEEDVSEQRRDVYGAYERLQAELTRRYRDGLADADELLRHS